MACQNPSKRTFPWVLLQALRDWVAVESDSSNVLKRPELHRMMEMVAQKLRQMGGTVELVDVGEQEVSARATPHRPRLSQTPQ